MARNVRSNYRGLSKFHQQKGTTKEAIFFIGGRRLNNTDKVFFLLFLLAKTFK